MSGFTDEELAKIPVWARHRIRALMSDLAVADQKLSAGPEDSDTFADPYSDTPRPLGKRPTIMFGDDASRPNFHGFRVRLQENGMLDVNGDTMFVIHPAFSAIILAWGDRPIQPIAWGDRPIQPILNECGMRFPIRAGLCISWSIRGAAEIQPRRCCARRWCYRPR